MIYMSDAIREGCKTTYKVRGMLYDRGRGRCMWGAALEGAVGSIPRSATPGYGIVDYYRLTSLPVWSTWVCLNDTTSITREEIADLVELKEYELGIRKSVFPVTNEGVALVPDGTYVEPDLQVQGVL